MTERIRQSNTSVVGAAQFARRRRLSRPRRLHWPRAPADQPHHRGQRDQQGRRHAEIDRGPAEAAVQRTGRERRQRFGRLSRIYGSGYADLYHSIRAAYAALSELKDDLETLQQMVRLDGDSVEIFQAQKYIANAKGDESASCIAPAGPRLST